MSFEPCSILFYGGPLHGRIMAVDRSTYVVNKQGPPQFFHYDNATRCMIPVPRQFYYKYTYKYTPIQESVYLHDPKFGSRTGVLKRDSIAYAMVCDVKKYDSDKVWRMMIRYKTMPGYKSQTLPVN